MTACSCTHAPEQHLRLRRNAFDDGSTCTIEGCRCTATSDDMLEDATAAKIAAWLVAYETDEAFRAACSARDTTPWPVWAAQQINQGAWRKGG